MTKLVTTNKIVDVGILDKLIQVKESRLFNLQSSYAKEGISNSRIAADLEEEIKGLKERKERIEAGLSVDLKEEDDDWIPINAESSSVRRMVTVNWDDVSFGDNVLIVCIEGRTYTKLKNGCRQSYNYIKPVIIKRLSPLKLTIDDEQIINFINYEELENALVLLKFRNTFRYNGKDNHQMSFREYIKNFSHILFHMFLPQDRTSYLDFLCKIQSENYAVVPLIEKISRGDTYQEEDAFLFTAATANFIYIIWENINTSRATYVFESCPNKYMESLQKVFDFAASSNFYKRSKIHVDRQLRQELGLNKIINHTSFREWKYNFPYDIAFKDSD